MSEIIDPRVQCILETSLSAVGSPSGSLQGGPPGSLPGSPSGILLPQGLFAFDILLYSEVLLRKATVQKTTP